MPRTVPGIARRDWHRARRGATGTLCGLVLLALAPAIAQAGVGAAAAPTFPDSVTVGAAGLPASIELTNSNTDESAGNANTVCNAGDPMPCPSGAQGITLIPSCGEQGDDSACTPAGADPGVFRLSETGTGAAGTACAGMVFDITPIPSDATFGRMRFTPRGDANVALPRAGAFCRIGFTFSVLKAPTIDLDPGTPGVQTAQVADNLQYSILGTAFGRGSIQGTTVLRATPTIATIASGDIVLGGQLSDNAKVIGRVNPVAGATVDFRLYGPDDANCSGTPVFESLGQPLGANDTATSESFTPTTPGVYRWRAFYSGDANNNPVSGACNAADEQVTVSPTPPTTPPTTPTTPPTTPTTPTTTPQTTPTGVAPAPPATPAPRIGVRGYPSKCTGSNFKLRVIAQVAGLESVRVTLDGKTIARSKKGRFNVRVNARATEFGRHVLRVIAQGASGETARTVTFKRCGRATLPRFVG